MLKMICVIPNHIGWIAVGALGVLCGVMIVALGRVFIEMWRERHEEEEE